LKSLKEKMLTTNAACKLAHAAARREAEKAVKRRRLNELNIVVNLERKIA